MMAFAIQTLREAGYKPIILWTFESNARARHFYEKAGFTQTGRKKECTIGKPLQLIEYAL